MSKTLRQAVDASADDVLALYFADLGRVPLLTADEEVALAKRIEAGRMARDRLARDGLDPDQRARAERAVADGRAALDHLVRANVGLVIKEARRRLGHGVPLPDLVQEGNVGLLTAAAKFDYRRGLRFSTYATWWISQAIRRAIADQSRTIRLPAWQHERLGRLSRVASDLEQQTGGDCGEEELAQAAGVDVEEIRHLRRVSATPLSLDGVPTGGGTSLDDFVAAEAPGPAGIAEREELLRDVEAALATLPSRQRRVLEMHLGLGGSREHTLEEIGQALGVTRERARQLEEEALERLRHPAVARRLMPYCRGRKGALE